jgi:hypothetical protein
MRIEQQNFGRKQQPDVLAVITIIAALSFAACTNSSRSPGTAASTSAVNANPASYTPRIGIGVSTNSRTCIAIRNGNLANGTVITLISPMAPVTFTQATVSGVAQQACPVTQNVDTTVSNYNVTPQIPVQKLTPLLAVLGTPVLTVNGNNLAQTETFRACSADDGIHLTVWNGAPLNGRLLWHGYYYESTNPGIGPSCTPGEVPAS